MQWACSVSDPSRGYLRELRDISLRASSLLYCRRTISISRAGAAVYKLFFRRSTIFFTWDFFLYGDWNAVPLLRYSSVCGSWLKVRREGREYPSRSPEWLSEEWLWELATLIRLKNVNYIFMSLTTYGLTLILPKFILYIQIGGWDVAKLLKLYNSQSMCWRNESYCLQSKFPKDTFSITKFLWNA